MKLKKLTKLFGLFIICVGPFILAQTSFEFLGLKGKHITELEYYGGMIFAGTDGEGVFKYNLDQYPDTTWEQMGLAGARIMALYAHDISFGPLGGWALAAGVIFPEDDDSTYIYCNVNEEGFIPNSNGISDVWGIYDLDGFTDVSICGEKYAAAGPVLFRNKSQDTIWTAIWAEDCIEGCFLRTVKTGEKVGIHGLVMAAGDGGFGGPLLLKSTDFGDSWEMIGVTGGSISDFDFDSDSTHTFIEKIFVVSNYILRSLDGGLTWDQFYPGDGVEGFHKILYYPDRRILIAVGTGGFVPYSKIYYSLDLGDTWKGGPGIYGYISGIAVINDQLIITNSNAGVFRLDLDVLNIEFEVLSYSYSLHQNHPNPFNPVTTIRYELPRYSKVRLSVYDILGREVAVLGVGDQRAGVREIQWDASNVPSGIYFIQMLARQPLGIGQAGEFRQVRKVMVLK